MDYVRNLKEKAGLPIAAASARPSSMRTCSGLEMPNPAAMGSHIINLLDTKGMAAVDEFLAACTK